MPVSEKIDLFKSLKREYAAPRTPAFVETTPGHYLRIEGAGKPGGKAFTDAVGALYAVAYTTKMRHKKGTGTDYVVGKLECIWPHLPETRDSDDWHWQLHIRIPDFVAVAERDAAVDALLSKKKPETVREVKLVQMHEGRCVQALHVGPYEDEATTFGLMEAFASKAGFDLAGYHHEIYISDPRRVEPKRLKTILRRPVHKLAD